MPTLMHKPKKILKKLIIMLMKGIRINGKRHNREGNDCLRKKNLAVSVSK